MKVNLAKRESIFLEPWIPKKIAVKAAWQRFSLWCPSSSSHWQFQLLYFSSWNKSRSVIFHSFHWLFSFISYFSGIRESSHLQAWKGQEGRSSRARSLLHQPMYRRHCHRRPQNSHLWCTSTGDLDQGRSYRVCWCRCLLQGVPSFEICDQRCQRLPINKTACFYHSKEYSWNKDFTGKIFIFVF